MYSCKNSKPQGQEEIIKLKLLKNNRATNLHERMSAYDYSSPSHGRVGPEKKQVCVKGVFFTDTGVDVGFRISEGLTQAES